MRSRYPELPTLWLMTDERQGEALWPALAALPRGSGVVFRHHRTADPERSAMLGKVARWARRQGLVLGVERLAPVRIVLPWYSAGKPVWIARAHTWREGVAARDGGAAAIFVSPVFATPTHPARRPLGPLRAAAIARVATLPAIALGGMTERRFTRLKGLGFCGWAAIDGLTPAVQKRKAVPI